MIIFGLLFYLLPTSLAALRRRKAFLWILGINVLLGWTLIGWIVTLIWAFVGKPLVDPKPRSKATSFSLGALVGLSVISLFVILSTVPRSDRNKENTTVAIATAVPSETPLTPVATAPTVSAIPTMAAASATTRSTQVVQPLTKPTATSENIVKIGEEFKLGDYTYRITGFKLASRVGNEFSQETAEEGESFVLVSFTIRNDTNKTQQVLADDFKIKDEQGREFSYDSRASTALAMSGGKKDMFFREIQPGA